MIVGTMKLRFGVVLLLLCLILAVLGYFTATQASGAGQAYEQSLIAFAKAERVLSEDIQDLQVGAVRHFDTLADDALALRRAASALEAVPREVESATAFNESRLQLLVLVNERMALVERFKTSLATMQVGLDTLPDQIAAADPEAVAVGADLQSLLVRMAGNLARLAHEPGAGADEQLASELATLAEAAGDETSTTYKAGLAALARQGESLRARKKELDTVVLQMASSPLSDRSFELLELYQAAESRSRQRTVFTLGAVLAVLIVGLAAFLLTILLKIQRELASAINEQKTIKEALKGARNQSVNLQRGEKEQSAQLAEERHNALVQHAFDLMAILSRQENYIHVSPASMAFFGLTEKEMIGRSVYEGIHADDIIKVQDYLARAQRELQTEQTIQYRVMDAFGKWHLVETFASNHASNPAVRGMVLNSRLLGAAPDPRSR